MQSEKDVIVQAKVLRCGCWEFKLPHGKAVLHCGPHAVLEEVRGRRKASIKLVEDRWVWI